MKNVMVANSTKKTHWREDDLELMLKAQIENSLELGWDKKDICIITNFDFEYNDIKAMKAKLNKHCPTGSKMFAIQWLITQELDEVYWTHDLDCWQGVPFECPTFKDVGLCEYSQPKFNGGSVFWRSSGRDIIDTIANTIVKEKSPKEEPVLNKLLKSDTYKHRVTILNSTYNIGCSGFVPRYTNAIKPIRVSHFHPTNRIAWETHALDRNQLGHRSINDRLEALIRKFYPNIAHELAKDDAKNKNKKLKPDPTPYQ